MIPRRILITLTEEQKEKVTEVFTLYKEVKKSFLYSSILTLGLEALLKVKKKDKNG